MSVSFIELWLRIVRHIIEINGNKHACWYTSSSELYDNRIKFLTIIKGWQNMKSNMNCFNYRKREDVIWYKLKTHHIKLQDQVYIPMKRCSVYKKLFPGSRIEMYLFLKISCTQREMFVYYFIQSTCASFY